MITTFWQRVDLSGRSLAPVAITMLVILVNVVPTSLAGFDRVVPSLSMMAVYFWAIHRPDLLRPSAAFGLGLIEDILAGTPIGLSALTLILVHWTVVTQRAFFLAGTFVAIWGSFGLIAFAIACLRWLLQSILHLSLLPIDVSLFQALLTVALFPPVAWTFLRIQRSFLMRS